MNKLKIGQQINKQDTICNEINLYFYIIERAGIVILTNFDEFVACGCVCVWLLRVRSAQELHAAPLLVNDFVFSPEFHSSHC